MLGKKSSVSNSPVAIIAGIDNYGRFWVFFIRVWTNPLYKADAVGLVIIQKRIISLWMTSGSILDTLIKKGDNYQSKLLSGFHHLEWLLWVWDLSLGSWWPAWPSASAASVRNFTRGRERVWAGGNIERDSCTEWQTSSRGWGRTPAPSSSSAPCHRDIRKQHRYWE